MNRQLAHERLLRRFAEGDLYVKGRWIVRKDGSILTGTVRKTDNRRYLVAYYDKPYVFTYARIIYEAHHGPIPEDMTIEHKDGDKDNNEISNLELLGNMDNGERTYNKTRKHPIEYRNIAKNKLIDRLRTGDLVATANGVIDSDGKRLGHICKQRGYAKVYRISARCGTSQKDPKYNFSTARIVYEALIGPIPYNMTVNHKDDVCTNVAPDNLELMTFTQNIQHAINTGLILSGERHPAAKMRLST